MKTVVLVSGGLDSTVLLYSLHAEGEECYPLTFDYGQRHSREIVAARNVCEAKSSELLKRWQLVALRQVSHQLMYASALTGSVEIPKGEYTEESLKQTVVPNRNMIFLALAAAYAQSMEADQVAYAAHCGDHPLYPDCRLEFVQSCAQTIELATELKLSAPFVNLVKADIIKRGVTYRVPFSMTWSCYVGGEKHCGECSTCVERKKAFVDAGVADPTDYESSNIVS